MQENIGFKQTEIGAYPNDWNIIRLGDVFDVIRNGTCYDTNNKSGYPMCRIETMSKGRIDYDHVGYSEKEPIKYKMQAGDILFSHINSIPYIGKVAFYDGKRPLYHGMNVLLLRCKKEYHSKFVFYMISSYKMKHTFELIAKPAVNQASISTKDLADVLCAIPPSYGEQKLIADNLDIAYNAIVTQGSTIEKKKNIKVGAMQMLLSGMRTLSGSKTKWVSSILEDVCSVSKGSQFDSNKFISAGKYPMLNGGISPSGYSNEYNAEANTITISEGGNSCGYVNLMKSRFWCGGHCYSIHENYCIDKVFLYHLLKNKESDIMRLRVGSGLPNIQIKDLLSFVLYYPEDINEQKAIAGILTEMDDEIDLLETAVQKYNLIMQGMMQELLTGKTRLLQ